MLQQQRHPGEGLGAVATAVLLHVRVGLQVSSQVGPVGEGAGTVRAGEGLLPGVRPQVALQQPGSGEGLAAHAALARQSVGPDVHLERAQRRVALVAVLAAEVLLDLRRAVELLVLGQPPEGGVALPASFAVVPGSRLGCGRDVGVGVGVDVGVGEAVGSGGGRRWDDDAPAVGVGVGSGSPGVELLRRGLSPEVHAPGPEPREPGSQGAGEGLSHTHAVLQPRSGA